MKLKNLMSVLLCTAMIVVCSCKKEGPAGPQGPQGVAGAEGAAGAKGAKGEKGDKGDPGTANVHSSTWKAVPFSPIGSGGSGYQGVMNAAEITSSVLDKGLVVVYMKLKVAPHTVSKLNYVENIYWVNMGLRVGKIEMTSNYKAGNFNTFRYVVIPGGAAARFSATPPDLADYSAVCRYYGIPE